jgi:hypothetical protein
MDTYDVDICMHYAVVVHVHQPRDNVVHLKDEISRKIRGLSKVGTKGSQTSVNLMPFEIDGDARR